jgi:hypothetical protein
MHEPLHKDLHRPLSDGSHAPDRRLCVSGLSSHIIISPYPAAPASNCQSQPGTRLCGHLQIQLRLRTGTRFDRTTLACARLGFDVDLIPAPHWPCPEPRPSHDGRSGAPSQS